MAEKPLRVILDTNIWISFLISNRHSTLDSIIAMGSVRLLFSEESLAEFLLVAQRPKFEQFFSAEDIQSLLGLFNEFGELINVTSTIAACRDPKDDFLLALAKDGRADFLITGDKDLLELVKFGGAKIKTIKEFEEFLLG